MRPVSRALAVLAVALLAAPALAGCLGDDPVPAQRKVSASGGKVSEGWAYDGAGLVDGAGTLQGTLDQEQDVGSVSVSFTFAGSVYEATFDKFAESKPFQAGGVVFELDEHGDTGVADASIPKIHATIAAWGAAKLTRDGKPVVGKAGDAWTAHLMVSRDTVRGTDGKILNAAGSAPYSPEKPADARRVEGDPQALFFVKHPDGETAKRPSANASLSASFSGADETHTLSVPAEAGAASATINVTASAASPAPVGVGQVAIRIMDANGTELASEPAANVLPNQPVVKSFALEAAQITGPLTVELRGSGAFGVAIDYVVAYDDHPFLVLTWDDVTVE